MMPFPGGIDANPNATLLFSLVAAVIYTFTLTQPPRLARTAAKTLAVAMLAALAFMQGGPGLLVAALALSAIGDAFLSYDSEPTFLGGLGSFLLAHVLYIALFAHSGGGFPAFAAEPWRAVVAVAMAVFALAMLSVLWRRVGAGLRVPVAVYVVAILAIGIAALTVNHPWVIVGAILFMASDALLATEKFVMAPGSPHRAWTRYAVWVLYYVAQVAITLAFLLGDPIVSWL